MGIDRLLKLHGRTSGRDISEASAHTKPTDPPSVDLYEDHHFFAYVEFKSKFWAFIFHTAVMKSINHQGVRRY